MKFAVAAALFALAAAQTAADIPSCAKDCLDKAAATAGCSTTDYPCICAKKDELQGAATGCVLSACGADVALNKVLPAVNALCAAQGTKAPASSSAPATSASESSAPATSAPATSAPATSAPATTVAPKSTTVSCDTTTMVSQTHAGNQTQPTTSVPVAAGAAGLSAGVAAIALAALAL